MLTIFIGVAVGVLTALVTSRDLGVAWGIFCGMVALMAVQLLIGLWIRRKINALNVRIQQQMEAAQAKINRKIQMFQQRPVGNVKMAQQMLEKEQAAAIRDALGMLDEAKRFYLWNFLLKKQIATMQMMFFFQLREFDKVDAMLSKCVFFDPRSIAVKLSRMYKKNDPGLDKFYAKKSRRFKGEDCAFLASLYAWIQLKRDDAAGALKTLVEAKKKTDNATVLENWERLANGKVKNFSNAGLGDAWYSLYLEEPKIKPQRAQQRPF